MSIYPTFAEALRTVMSAHQWSSETLADVVGYRSKTSVVRILQEKSSQLNRQQFFNRLMDAQALRPYEIELLRNALNTSMIGKDQAMCPRHNLRHHPWVIRFKINPYHPTLNARWNCWIHARRQTSLWSTACGHRYLTNSERC